MTVEATRPASTVEVGRTTATDLAKLGAPDRPAASTAPAAATGSVPPPAVGPSAASAGVHRVGEPIRLEGQTLTVLAAPVVGDGLVVELEVENTGRGELALDTAQDVQVRTLDGEPLAPIGAARATVAAGQRERVALRFARPAGDGLKLYYGRTIVALDAAAERAPFPRPIELAEVRPGRPGAIHRPGEALQSDGLVVTLLEGRAFPGGAEAEILIHNVGPVGAVVSPGNYRLFSDGGRPRMRLREPPSPLPIGWLAPGDTLRGRVSWESAGASDLRVAFVNGSRTIEWALPG